jgi:uncharacterized protein
MCIQNMGRSAVMSRTVAIGALLLVSLVGWMPARAAEPDWPDAITIATASPGGTYYVYGDGLARILTRTLGIRVSMRATEGPTENIKLEQFSIQLGVA